MVLSKQFNRERNQRWGARTLDIELLAYNEIVLPELKIWHEIAGSNDMLVSDLILPHPRLHKRLFVLEPFLEIAPHWAHPILGKTADDLCKQIKAKGTAGVIERLSLKLL